MSSKGGPSASGKDLRCICGRMTARLEPQGLVIKCQRCGKLMVLSLSRVKGLKQQLEFHNFPKSPQERHEP
ncbi:MAG: hypothetical protein K0S45_4498 [Nitrospira sp.]|jgi:hypothetical protein|nr:hypothetical protein [Nitrospira sp.]